MITIRKISVSGVLAAQIVWIATGCHKKSKDDSSGNAGSGAYMTALALGGSNTTVTTPCTSHAGPTLPHEGTGACTGNLFITVALPTAQIGLHYNSVRTNYTHCLSAGWSFDFERFLTSDSQNYVVTEGSGFQVKFPYNSSTGTTGLFSEDPSISRNRVSAGSPSTELLPNGTTIEYGATWSGTPMISKISDRSGNAVTYSTNSNGCFTSIHTPAGETISFSYNSSGRVSSVQDNAGSNYTFTYDGSGNLTQVQQPDNRSWKFEYLSGTANMTKLTNPLAEVTAVEYISGSPVVSMITNPNNYQTQYSYTATTVVTAIAGQPSSQSIETFDAAGYLIKSAPNGGFTWTEYNRDGFHRVNKITDEYKKETIIGYVNPPSGNGLGAANYKLPHSIFAPDGSLTSISYDSNSNVVSTTTTLGSQTIAKTQTWDEFSQMLTLTINGRTATFTRSNGYLTSLSNQNGRTVGSASYDSLGHLTSETDDSGLTTNYTWSNDKVSTITDYLGRTITFTYDQLGHPLSATESTGRVDTFSYDVMGVLTAYNTTTSGNSSKSYGMHRIPSFYNDGQPSAIENQVLVNGSVTLRDILSFVHYPSAFRKFESTQGNGTSLYRTSETVSGNYYYKVFNANPVPAVTQ